MPGRVYPSERREAERQDAEQNRIVRPGVAASKRIGSSVETQVLRAYRSGRDIVPVFKDYWLSLMRPLLTDGIMLGRLTGARRAVAQLPDSVPVIEFRAAPTDAHKAAMRAIRGRLKTSPQVLAFMEQQAGIEALRVLGEASAVAEVKLQQAVLTVTRDNLHVREGTKRIKQAMDAAGVTARNSYMAENIYRTQTQLAYAAGKREIETHPEVDEILWGYKYVTVGDDRVRPGHAAIEGTTLPKNDGFWASAYPPNGFSCRCQAIPIYEPRITVQPAEGGQPDAGFDYDPGRVFSPLLGR